MGGGPSVRRVYNFYKKHKGWLGAPLVLDFMFPRAIPQLVNSFILLPRITSVNMIETMAQIYVGIFGIKHCDSSLNGCLQKLTGK